MRSIVISYSPAGWIIHECRTNDDGLIMTRGDVLAVAETLAVANSIADSFARVMGISEIRREEVLDAPTLSPAPF